MNCPQCGATNRPGARFCGQCRAALPAGLTMKVCPQCGKGNRMGAKFCGDCGYTFSSSAGDAVDPAAPARSIGALVAFLQSRRGRWLAVGASAGLVALIALVLITAALGAPRSRVAGQAITRTPSVRPSASPTPGSGSTSQGLVEEALHNALLSTVQIMVPIDSNSGSSGSGSILTSRGHILTNFHVIGDPDTGQLYNASGLIYVAVNPPDLRSDPEIRYVATLVEADTRLDLALLKISRLSSGQSLPPDLALNVMPLGDSDTVNIGDQLSIIGFPGLGGNTVTYTRGSVSGFLTGEGWIKTDAEINSGNSGGAAIDGSGKLVGIPSAANAEKTRVPGKIGLVRPINLAGRLVGLANADAR